MIKIVHMITGLGMGGAERQLVRLILHSDTTRFQHIVISLKDEGVLGEELKARGIKLYTLNMKKKGFPIFPLWNCFKILKSEKPIILQSWLYHADLLAIFLGKCLGLSNVVWNIRCSNLDLKCYSRLTKWVLRVCAFLSCLPKAIIVNSKAGLKVHQNFGFKPKCWKWIPNGFETNIFKPNAQMRSKLRKALGIGIDVPLLGLFARFDPMKDHKTLLAAIEILRRSTPSIHLLLVGLGMEPSNLSLMTELTKCGLNQCAFLLGLRKDIPDLLSMLDLFVLSSSFGEGFPNVLGEAMACGIPCIATNVGDSALIIGDAGIVVKPRCVPEMVSAIQRFLNMSNLERQDLGVSARNRIVDHYSIETCIKKYELFYEELCVV